MKDNRKRDEKKMATMKTMCSVLALGIFCAGCVSDPFISDSIDKLDIMPMACELPGAPASPVEPFSREKLLGGWESGVVKSPWRRVDGYGVHSPGVRIMNKQYMFFSDGSYCKAEGMAIVSMSRSVNDFMLKSKGYWSYDKGVLTLNMRYYELDINCGELSSGEKSHKAEKCNRIKKVNVICYDNDEIAIEEQNPPKDNSSANGDRELVTVDSRGVRVERTIKVTGMRDGKEIGTVDERTIPPIRFRRKKKE